MLTKDCRAVLRKAGEKASGEITYDAAASALKWTPEKTRRVCDHLLLEGYADDLRKNYFTATGGFGAGPSCGIILTEKGKHWRRIAALAVARVIFFDVILPVAASIATTIILDSLG